MAPEVTERKCVDDVGGPAMVVVDKRYEKQEGRDRGQIQCELKSSK
jgi:hypothetical protein